MSHVSSCHGLPPVALSKSPARTGQIFSQIETGEDAQELNRCTLCDEKRCGIAFVECAGANRRRTAIISDIERDTEQEVCESVDQAWWRNNTIGDLWRKQGG